MEKVDIIDPDNNVVGIDTRDNAHKLGLLHRCVIGELKDSKGNWIFVKQAGGMQDSGQLASAVGGHVESRESAEDALGREIGEELGIKNFTSKHRGNIIFRRRTLGRDENHFFIVYDIISGEKITLNEESEDYISMTSEELKEKLKTNTAFFGGALIYIIDKLYPELKTS